MHNYAFLSFQNTLKKKTIFLKSLVFFFLILNFYFKKKVVIVLKKKKTGDFNIFKAPYKNKLAQRKYCIKRCFFFVSLVLASRSKSAKSFFFKNLRLIQFLGNNFFYLKATKLKFFI